MPASRRSALDSTQDLGFFSLLHLAQAIGEVGIVDSLSLVVLSDDIHSIAGRGGGQPEKATLLGPLRVIPQEYPNITCAGIDLELPDEEAALTWLVDQILAEASRPSGEPLTAYRGRQRWLRDFEPLELEEPSRPPSRLRPEGVYWITGGLGSIGLEIARYLAREVGAKLILTSRTPLPPREEWAEAMAEDAEGDGRQQQVLREVLRLEELGAEVLTLAADVADSEAMEKALAEAQRHFGAIHGVVHAAGVPGGGILQLKSRDQAREVLRPKLDGTLVLDRLLAGDDLDFLLLCSSTFALRGGVGRVDYCAANAFLDAFAQSCDGGSRYVVAVDWDGWSEVGMAAETTRSSPQAAVQTPPSEPSPAAAGELHPLLDRRLPQSDSETVFATDLDVRRHWALAEHRVEGMPVLPGTALIEMARAGWRADAGECQLGAFRRGFSDPAESR